MAREAVLDGTTGKGRVRHGKAVLFQGSSKEKAVSTGDQWVRGAESRFKSSAVTNMGPEDAVNARRARDGKPPAKPFRVKAAEAAGRVAKRIEERKAERKAENVAAGLAEAPPGLPQEYAEIGASLAQFEDDPEMQATIFKKWQANKAKKARAAAAERKPETTGAPA